MQEYEYVIKGADVSLDLREIVGNLMENLIQFALLNHSAESFRSETFFAENIRGVGLSSVKVTLLRKISSFLLSTHNEIHPTFALLIIDLCRITVN